jgi:hypothetical protein
MYYKTKPETTPEAAFMFAYKQWKIQVGFSLYSNFIKATVNANRHQLFPILFVDGFAVCKVIPGMHI